MHNELQVSSRRPPALSPRDARQGRQSLSRTALAGIVRRDAISTETSLTIAKMDSVTDVYGAAMFHAARAAQARTQLELRDPGLSRELERLDGALNDDLLVIAASHARNIRNY